MQGFRENYRNATVLSIANRLFSYQLTADIQAFPSSFPIPFQQCPAAVQQPLSVSQWLLAKTLQFPSLLSAELCFCYYLLKVKGVLENFKNHQQLLSQGISIQQYNFQPVSISCDSPFIYSYLYVIYRCQKTGSSGVCVESLLDDWILVCLCRAYWAVCRRQVTRTSSGRAGMLGFRCQTFGSSCVCVQGVLRSRCQITGFFFSRACAGGAGLQVLDDWILPTLANKGDKVDLRCNYILQVI